MGKIIATIPCTGKTFHLKRLNNSKFVDDGSVMRAFQKQHSDDFNKLFDSGLHKNLETYNFTLTDPFYYGYFDFAMNMANYYSDQTFFLVGPFNFIKDKTIEELSNFKNIEFKAWIPTDEELFFNYKCRKIELQGTELHYYDFPLLSKIKERMLETADLYKWPIYDSFQSLLQDINN